MKKNTDLQVHQTQKKCSNAEKVLENKIQVSPSPWSLLGASPATKARVLPLSPDALSVLQHSHQHNCLKLIQIRNLPLFHMVLQTPVARAAGLQTCP